MVDRKTAHDINREAYQAQPGLQDYWNKMAAPRRRVAVMTELISSHPHRSVVDLGCGNGAFLQHINPSLERAGIVLSPEQNSANVRTQSAIEWLAADLENPSEIPESWQNRFDAVSAMEVVEHLKDPLSFLQSALTLARPGGRLYLSTQSGPIRHTEKQVGHQQHFTAAAMARLLTQAGWISPNAWNEGYPFHDLSKWYANRNPDKSMKDFGEGKYGLKQNAICLGLRVLFRFNSRQRGAQLFAVAEKPQ